MAKMLANPRSFLEAQAVLGGRAVRKLGHNTWLESHQYNSDDEPMYCIRYHRTIIVKWTPDKTVFYDGGWQTYTTKQRINEFLPAGYRLSSERYAWKLHTAADGTIDWHSGVTFKADTGRVLI